MFKKSRCYRLRAAALLFGGNTMLTNKPVKGNEAEEFIKLIVLKVFFVIVVLVVGVGFALYI
jgi:heme/copper-type cytochrome/quinol oxidase subunit 2